jgi:hypothetical protein
MLHTLLAVSSFGLESEWYPVTEIKSYTGIKMCGLIELLVVFINLYHMYTKQACIKN